MDATIHHDPFLPDSEAETPETEPTLHDHTQDKSSHAAVKKMLDRKSLANHKKRMTDASA